MNDSNGFIPAIEKGIPLPERKWQLPLRWLFLESMEPGDSVFLPNSFTNDIIRSWRGKSSIYRKYPDRKYVSRTVEGGIRIWRLS